MVKSQDRYDACEPQSVVLRGFDDSRRRDVWESDGKAQSYIQRLRSRAPRFTRLAEQGTITSETALKQRNRRLSAYSTSRGGQGRPMEPLGLRCVRPVFSSETGIS